MSYLSPLNPAGMGFDGLDRASEDEISTEDDSGGDDVQRDPGVNDRFDGRFNGKQGEIRSLVDELRELRQRDGCERDDRAIELEPGPRKLL